MQESSSAAISALAVAFPEHVRTNDYYEKRVPAVVAKARESGLVTPWTNDEGNARTNRFDRAMAPYLADPFQGAKLRHILAPGQTAKDLELQAARAVLAAAGVDPRDVGLMLSTSFLPDTIGIGQSAFVAEQLGLGGTAWNLETACASAIAGLEIASVMVAAGRYQNVLVVLSCTYSRVIDDDNPLSWTTGDGAAAFLVSSAPEGRGLLGARTMHTGATCGSFFYELTNDGGRGPRIQLRAAPEAGRILREMSEVYVRECCEGALKDAGVSLDEIALVVPNTPVAWFAAFVADVLGIDSERVIDGFGWFGNVGPVLLPANLYVAAAQGRLAADDLVLLYGIGSVSSTGAAVIRWSDVKISGEVPSATLGRASPSARTG